MTKQLRFFLWPLLAFFLYSPWLHAGATPFLITNRTSDLPSGDPVRDGFNSAADSMQTSINGGFLSETSRQTFDDALGKANSSNMGMLLTDRASNPSKFSVSIGGQAGVSGDFNNLNGTANNNLPSVGFGSQATLLVGIKASNLGFGKKGIINGEKLMLYLNTFFFSTTVSQISARVFNVGLNAQYKLVDSIGTPLAGWGGVALSSGLNYSTTRLTYGANLTQTSQASVGGQTATLNLNMNYDLGVKSSNFLIPLEVSTNVTLLYAFTLYLGGSVDFNIGSAGLTGTASGPVTATYSGATSTSPFAGDATINLDDDLSGKTSLLTLRGFGGLQLNVSLLKIALEGAILSNGAKQAGVILRVAM